MKKLLPAYLLVVAVCGLLSLGIFFGMRSVPMFRDELLLYEMMLSQYRGYDSFTGSYPTIDMSPPQLPEGEPPVIELSFEEILQQLDAEIREHNPAAARLLRPSITPEALSEIEEQLGMPLHPEIQQFYRWHNGVGGSVEVFDMYTFVPLDDAVQTTISLRQYYEANEETAALMAHEKYWIEIFPDGAGDGYYYDPSLPYERGAVFYNFRESGYYMLFPSIKHLMMAILECYQNDVYKADGEMDYELEQQIMERYGVEFSQ